MTYIHSFPPISNPSATRLILGTMPGKASLAANQYYVFSRNYFWTFLGESLDFDPGLPYEARCQALLENRIALWDVLKACTRSSSLDSDIEASSIVPNEFESFFQDHPHIGTIFFNGARAEKIYLKHVQPGLPVAVKKIRTVRLPSTSPANAAIPKATKLQQWRQIKGQGNG